MFTPRRSYIYAVAAIGLQATTWAAISLLRNLFVSGFSPDTTALAFQIAVIVIALPVYLAHFLRGQRISQQDVEERGAGLRRLYVYGMQAAFLIPLIDSAFALITTLFFFNSGSIPRPYSRYPPLSPGDTIIYYLLALLVLGPLWYFHQRIHAEDAKVIPETGGAASVRRVYVYYFSASGLTMTIIAFIALLRWLLFQFGGEITITGSVRTGPIYEIARLIIGLPLWLIFWRWAQSLFMGPDEEEHESALRKFYLYLIIFVSVLACASSATFILEGIFRRLLELPSKGLSQGDIRLPLSIISGMAIQWAYHASVIKRDIQHAKETAHQAGVRWLSRYLIAGIGFSVLLIGLIGMVDVSIRSFDQASFGIELYSQVTWFTAMIIAGLPIWVLPWRLAQIQSRSTTPEGASERRSSIRKTYLYIFIFVATVTALYGVVYLVYQILITILGDAPPTIIEVSRPIARSLIAIAVWIYHNSILRYDNKLATQDRVGRLEGFRVAVVDVGERNFVQAIVDKLEREFPGISTNPIVLTEGNDDEGKSEEERDILTKLGQAGLIVGPWMITVAGWSEGLVSSKITQAILTSPARKLLAPSWPEGWEWVGVDRRKRGDLVQQTVLAVKQMLEGEEVKPVKPLGAGAIIGIGCGVLILLSLLVIPLIWLLTR